MDKKELIAQMVENYNAQVRLVGGQTSLTLEEYLSGIMFRPASKGEENRPKWTYEDVRYGLSLQ